MSAAIHAKISHQRVLELFSCSLSSGDLLRRNTIPGGGQAGTVAGYLAKSGYRFIRVDGVRYAAHRLKWFWIHGSWPNGSLDHINHDKSDNRMENLRIATGSENQRNMTLPKDNTSGFIGVAYRKDKKKWCATIKGNGKAINLGHFNTSDEAVAARKKAEVKYVYHKNHGKTMEELSNG